MSVQADATIALPMLATALATSSAGLLAKRKRPTFTMEPGPMTIDGRTVPSERFLDDAR
ncbi:MAG: hypothetical protein HY047_04595 [Acidobacteria bacterium]|nr:hypothetical protein [Acidobacteriota bacterium]